jgi:hypothetical protein
LLALLIVILLPLLAVLVALVLLLLISLDSSSSVDKWDDEESCSEDFEGSAGSEDEDTEIDAAVDEGEEDLGLGEGPTELPDRSLVFTVVHFDSLHLSVGDPTPGDRDAPESIATAPQVVASPAPCNDVTIEASKCIISSTGEHVAFKRFDNDNSCTPEVVRGSLMAWDSVPSLVPTSVLLSNISQLLLSFRESSSKSGGFPSLN